jgi:hypothetical protein
VQNSTGHGRWHPTDIRFLFSELRAYLVKDWHRNFGGFQSIGFFFSFQESLSNKGIFSPKFLWLAIIHPNSIGGSTFTLTSFVHPFT